MNIKILIIERHLNAISKKIYRIQLLTIIRDPRRLPRHKTSINVVVLFHVLVPHDRNRLIAVSQRFEEFRVTHRKCVRRANAHVSSIRVSDRKWYGNIFSLTMLGERPRWNKTSHRVLFHEAFKSSLTLLRKCKKTRNGK